MIRNTAVWRLQFLSLIDDLVNSINRFQFLTSFRIAFSNLNRLNHITVFDDLIKYIFFSCRLFFINHIKNCFHIICLNGFHQNRIHWKTRRMNFEMKCSVWRESQVERSIFFKIFCFISFTILMLVNYWVVILSEIFLQTFPNTNTRVKPYWKTKEK